jgi:DNA-directed RNA polymerase specialized sigma subunit
MARARVRVPESLEDFGRSDWEAVIQEAALGLEDTRIAELYLLDAVAQADIGAELKMDRSTVSRRLIRIIDKIERSAAKLNLI